MTAPAANHRRLLLGSVAIMTGAAIASSLATQFVASRVGYHPAIGVPWVGHFYAPWKWIEWQASSWAPNAKATFQVVDSGLLAVTALAMFGRVAASTARRRRSRSGMRACTALRGFRRSRRSGGAVCCRVSPKCRMPACTSAAGRMRRERRTTSATTVRSIASSLRRHAAARASATWCRHYCHGRPVRSSMTRKANCGH